MNGFLKKERINFLGNYILVYNNIGKNSLIKSRVTDRKKILVTGMPRLDQLIKTKKKAR